MKRAAEVLTAPLLAAGLLAGCTSEPKPQPSPTPTPTEAQMPISVNTVAEARAKLQQGQRAGAYVLNGLVEPKGGVEGQSTVYHPLRFKGDKKLWYAVCDKSGKLALKPLLEERGTIYMPGGLIGQNHSRGDIPEIATEVTFTQGKCHLTSSREEFKSTQGRVGLIDTPWDE